MLELDVEIGEESYDEATEKFVKPAKIRVKLEHSLASVSKWESVWEKAFLGKEDKTNEQTISYVSLMILNDELPPGVFQKVVDDHLKQIKDYIAAPMTATHIHSDSNAPQSREVITSELIYYWMISLNVPAEYDSWHLNRLITLIRVINLKNTPKKKMSLNDRRSLNRQRLSKHHTQG